MRIKGHGKCILGLSGGPDSVYLLYSSMPIKDRLLIGHLNHGSRGRNSDIDMEFVEKTGRKLGVDLMIGKSAISGSGFEQRARDARRSFLFRVRDESRASKILLAHTADDQVETILMRVMEGAGIAGLKGIPRKTNDGIERPILDTWREDILEYLHKNKIPYRVDKSNFDTRFERNWIRHVLIPLLVERYGEPVKKRIFTMGERFREIDEFLDATANTWVKRNVKPGSAECAREGGSAATLPRKRYAKLPSALRIKIVQSICFSRIGVTPNERLLESMDRLLVAGKPSGRLKIGKGASLSCRYGEAVFRLASGEPPLSVRPGEEGHRPATGSRSMDRPVVAATPILIRVRGGKLSSVRLRKLAEDQRVAAFDAGGIVEPLTVRPLRAGDRIRPFGMQADRKVKEILIDRKILREERWGRPVVCDGKGDILWIPGVVRSAHAPVNSRTSRTVLLKLGGALSMRPAVSLSLLTPDTFPRKVPV